MIATCWRVPLLVGLLLAAAAPGGQAGTLSTFENGAHKTVPAADSGNDLADSCLSDLFSDVLADVFVIAFLYGGVSSYERMHPGADFDLDVDAPPRETGEALIPVLRVDVAYQDLETDVAAVDVRGELGYGPVGLHVNYTGFDESSPDDALTLIRVVALYRMSFDRYVEVDLGVGALSIDGEDRETHGLVTVPVLLNFGDVLGLEFRPAWAETLSDYDVAALLGWRFLSLKAGYRWLHAGDGSLDGPYAGVSFRF